MEWRAETVRRKLREQGIAVADAWLETCLATGHAAGAEDPLAWVFAQFLAADLRSIGDPAAVPPFDIVAALADSAQGVLRGRHVLQIDELADVSVPFDERWAASAASAPPAHRMMKLRLSSGPGPGCGTLFGVEVQRLPSLTAETRPGAKIALRDVPVRRGLLQLDPGNALVLGGCVTALADAAAAHARAIQRRKRCISLLCAPLLLPPLTLPSVQTCTGQTR